MPTFLWLRFVSNAMAGDGADGDGTRVLTGVGYRARWGCAITVVNPDGRIAFYYDPPRQPVALSNSHTDYYCDDIYSQPVPRSAADAAVSSPDSA